MSINKKITITGASAHLGSHLSSCLLREGYSVTGIDMVEPKSLNSEGFTFVNANLGDKETIKEAIKDCEIIVHCASIHPWKKYSDEQYMDCNIKGTWNLYAAASESGIRRIVLTSSIAAIGYFKIPYDAWPIKEDMMFPLGDIYSLTKHSQEDIARMFADKGLMRTVAIRPSAFMPRPGLDTAFSLTGPFAVVDDISSAHMAAIETMLGLKTGNKELEPFEAIFATNYLPYTREDIGLIEADGNILPLVRKYWSESYEWLIENGYKGIKIPGVYDISKAKDMLGWQPQFNFKQWREKILQK